MSYVKPQSKQEQRYWSILKRAPYYIYYADKKTGVPIDYGGMFFDKSDAQGEKDNPFLYQPGVVTRVGRFTLKQMDEILSFSKMDLYGSDWVAHRWEVGPAVDNVGDSVPVSDFAFKIILSNWKKWVKSNNTTRRR